MALPEHAMIEPIVAQLDARPKAELLKKRVKTIPEEWRRKITNWVERAEKANAKRNFVAHHGINISGDTITLHSGQLGKIMDSLDTSESAIKAGKAKGIKDMHEWIEQAKAAYEEGMTILANLDRFRVAALAKLAEPKV
jgi:gas vesicle protein